MLCMCMFECMKKCQDTCVSQRTAYRSLLSPSTMWRPEIELRSGSRLGSKCLYLLSACELFMTRTMSSEALCTLGKCSTTEHSPVLITFISVLITFSAVPALEWKWNQCLLNKHVEAHWIYKHMGSWWLRRNAYVNMYWVFIQVNIFSGNATACFLRAFCVCVAVTRMHCHAPLHLSRSSSLCAFNSDPSVGPQLPPWWLHGPDVPFPWM